MKKNQPKSLKEITDIWYQKLNQSGFRDIEQPAYKQAEPMLKTWDSHYFSNRYDEQYIETIGNYYLDATHFLNTHNFISQIERRIWQFHSDGKGLREISKYIRRVEPTYNKDKIGAIVRDLKEKMKLANYLGEGDEHEG